MRKLREFPLGSIQSSAEICQWYSIHWFDANNCVMFQEIWNEFIGVKKHDFLMKHNLGKRSINNKLFIHSAKVHKDFFRLLYHSYGLWIILKNESVEEWKNCLKILDLKVTGTKKELVVWVFAASENGVQSVKTAVEIESDLITDNKINLKLKTQCLTHLRYLMGGWKNMKE